MLKIDLEYKHKILYVRLKGILDRKNSYKIDTFLNPVLKKHQIKYLVYNFRFLKDIDESGIDSLIRSRNTIKENEGKIAICASKKTLWNKIKRLKIPEITNEFKAISLIEA